VHEAAAWGAIGDDVIGPVVDDNVIVLVVVDEVVSELLVVLVAREDVGELDDGADMLVVVVAEATDGRAAMQVQTAWADEDAGRALSPQDAITHPIAKF